ncbi:15649_t:CDS:1, partial [Gigaspora rosea]
MKFHSKKDPQQSIAILFKYWDKFHSEFLFLHKINLAESLSKKLEYDSHFVINHLSEFYLCIPEPLKIQAENQGSLFSENQEK